MTEKNKEIKKTAEAHGTLSEEVAQEKAQSPEEVSTEMIKEETEKEVAVEAEAKEEAVKEIVEKETAAKESGKPKKYARRGEPTTEEIMAAWTPKTKLGLDVKSGKIKNIDEILDGNKCILEPQIVDKLLTLKIDLIAQGQAKGKFGGGKRRAWRQTQRITKEGGVLTFSAMAVCGDEDGHIGIGKGRARETLPARDKATRKSKLNIMKVTRGCAAFDCNCPENHTVPFEVNGKSGSVGVRLTPAPQGTGLVCANELKKVLRMAGVKDVYSRVSGKTRTTFNTVKACIEALRETNRK
ncbi:MAG: 30S ribosomal protein S5 [Nanoarchaeota archaeon]|jgi:small subunit ribosomal protein S5|nr:30S ribosomal protein S5 [Nanoarchaeota archaeon]